MTGNSTDNFAVALVHEVCPICVKPMNHTIVIPKKFTLKAAAEVNAMNNQAIDISSAPCEDCSKYTSQDYVCCISIDPEKSNAEDEQVTLKDVYRTGQSAWVKRESLKGLFGLELKEPFLFMAEEAFNKMIQMATEQLGEIPTAE